MVAPAIKGGRGFIKDGCAASRMVVAAMDDGELYIKDGCAMEDEGRTI